jgi:hypothetical protein
MADGILWEVGQVGQRTPNRDVLRLTRYDSDTNAAVRLLDLPGSI